MFIFLYSPSHYFIFDSSLGCYDDMLSEEEIAFIVNYNKKTLLACPDAFKDAMRKFVDEVDVKNTQSLCITHKCLIENYRGLSWQNGMPCLLPEEV